MAVALAELDVVLASTPVAGEQLPVGVTLWDLDAGEELERFDGCPDLHGEAATEHLVAFGCSDGVLLVEHHDDGWAAHKVDHPAGVGPEDRTGSLVASPDGTALIGDLGRGALVRIDTESKTASRLALPAPMASFTVDGAGHLLVVTTDGHVHHLDAATGEVLGSVDAVDAFRLPEGHGGDPVPQLVAVGDHIFLTDPAGGALVELAVDDELEVARTIDVGGTPASVTVVGLPT